MLTEYSVITRKMILINICIHVAFDVKDAIYNLVIHTLTYSY